MVDIAKTGQSRVFLIDDRAGPTHTPTYMGLAKMGSISWPQGDLTPIRAPSSEAYDQFDVIDEIIGEQGLPQVTITTRYTREMSDLLRLARKRCPVDLQAHWGACRTPTDFDGGWDKVLVIEGARPTDYTTEGDIGALDSGEQAVVNEAQPFTGLDMYEIKRIVGSELAASAIVQSIIAVAICDSPSCGSCGDASNGVQKIFALSLSHGGSPGLPAEVIYSDDQGATVSDTNITSLAANEDPSAMACVGTRLVVASNESGSLHYATIADILAGDETWTEVATGIVAGKEPNAIFSLGTTFTWVVGDAGYIYFTDDVTAGLEVQDSGSATAQNLNAVHAYDENNVVAVGASNAVVFTTNGGIGWTAVTGPDVGVDLNTVWMRSKTEWWIGTAGGKLWYTTDSGASWTEKTFSGSGAGQVRSIVFATPTVGYMAHDTATPRGRIFRTINGGKTWYALPEDTGVSLPLADRFNALAAKKADVNFVLAGGLGDNAADGILVKVS